MRGRALKLKALGMRWLGTILEERDAESNNYRISQMTQEHVLLCCNSGEEGGRKGLWGAI